MSFELPDRMTPEWITQRVWRKTQYSELELSELGVLRRPHSSSKAGSLIYATPNKDFPPRYRITKLGGCKEKYVVDVEVMMHEVFGRFLNRSLLDYKYLTALKVLCMEYNKRYFSGDTYQDNKLLGVNPSQTEKKRLCAGVNGKTCGKMTYDYRCPACWVIIRGGDADREETLTYSVRL